MTPGEIDQVQRVIVTIGEHPEFGARFYALLFEADPAIAPMFGDVESQQRKLTDELAAMVDLLRDLATLDARAQALGARHRGYGVRSAHYALARSAMVDALREVLGPDFGPDQERAWDRATSLITELMQSA